jgi:hypothetical protein
MAIYCCAYLGDKQVIFTDLAAVKMQIVYLFVRGTDDLKGVQYTD